MPADATASHAASKSAGRQNASQSVFGFFDSISLVLEPTPGFEPGPTDYEQEAWGIFARPPSCARGLAVQGDDFRHAVVHREKPGSPRRQTWRCSRASPVARPLSCSVQSVLEGHWRSASCRTSATPRHPRSAGQLSVQMAMAAQTPAKVPPRAATRLRAFPRARPLCFCIFCVDAPGVLLDSHASVGKRMDPNMPTHKPIWVSRVRRQDQGLVRCHGAQSACLRGAAKRGDQWPERSNVMPSWPLQRVVERQGMCPSTLAGLFCHLPPPLSRLRHRPPLANPRNLAPARPSASGNCQSMDGIHEPSPPVGHRRRVVSVMLPKGRGKRHQCTVCPTRFDWIRSSRSRRICSAVRGLGVDSMASTRRSA